MDDKNGYGVETLPSGESFEGMFTKNNRHGEGKLHLVSGEIYEG